MITAPSQRFLDALSRSHERKLRVTLGVWDANGVLQPVGPIEVASGNLSIDSASAAWRRFTGRVTLPLTTGDALEGVNTFNGELSFEIGITFQGDVVDWVQIAQLRIEETNRPAGKAGGTVTAFDRAQRVLDFPFVTPYAPRDMNGNQFTAVNAIKDIITTAFPSLSPPVFVVEPGVDTAAVPPAETVFTGARWDAVLKLAQSVSAVVHNDNRGRFVIRSQDSPQTPVDELVAGPGGTLVESISSNTRVEQYNAVGMTSESPSGEGIFVYVVDNDPASPTYYDGPFGRKPYMTRNDTIVTVEAAIEAARGVLSRKKSAARDLALSSVYNPLLQPLDTIDVLEPRSQVRELHVIESIDLPLTGGAMSLKTHKWTAPGAPVLATVGGRSVI